MKLATYAINSDKSSGRLFNEQFESCRFPFLKDRERIIHSSAFRRLEYKTQVFVNHAGDHYRTRLTHTLEVAQVTKHISYELGINSDLAETIALCHDIGHPPFGHAGEDGLNEAANEFGGFDHNVQTMKVLTYLEQRYAEFDGLNLSWETLEGAVKHNGPIIGKHSKYKVVPKEIQELSDKFDLRLDSFASLEAQVAGLADDIAYCNHDIDDGIRAGTITLEELRRIELIDRIYQSVQVAYPKEDKARILNETIRRIVKEMVSDLVRETSGLIKDNKIITPEDVRNLGKPLACFSKEMNKTKDDLKSILMEKVYRDYRVNRMTIKAKRIVSDLFDLLMKQPDCLPTDWHAKVKDKTSKEKASVIKDYIAGMTDRFAIEEHRKLFNPNYY